VPADAAGGAQLELSGVTRGTWAAFGIRFTRYRCDAGRMPFTASHPAAVLPFLRIGLVPSALVIGSMAPDVPYFVPLPIGREFSHSFAGTITIDLYLGLALFAAWQAVLAAAVLAIAPPGLRRRLGPQHPAGLRHHLATARGLGLVVVSLIVGGVTHIVWDAFTHSGAWGTEHLPFLQAMYGPRPLYRWAQYASGLAGAVAILATAARWWRTTPPRTGPDEVRRPVAGRRLALLTWAAFASTAAVTAVVNAAGPLTSPWGADYGAAAFRGVTRGGVAGGAVLLVFALAWAVHSRRASPGGGGRRT
jgi:hypothetical protein